MKTRAGHLRLLPKPLAKCEPADYPLPPGNRIGILRVDDGRRWLLAHIRNERIVELWLSPDELRELHRIAGVVLAKEDGR
jgi:hypothetical protein